jgi:RIO kinase 1
MKSKGTIATMLSSTQLNFGHGHDDEEIAAFYEEQFNLPRSQEHRGRKPKNLEQKREKIRGEVADLADDAGLSAGFNIMYKPTRFEAEWLLTSLSHFFEQDLIVDVAARVQGGKEANVYRCQAHHSLETALVAAKVYRPRKFRNLRNDAMYREGRQILTEENGKPADPRDDRIVRAIGKKSAFGVQVQHTSWLMYEFKTLESLYKAGAAVPYPISAAENAILMGYLGDEYLAAPTLQETTLSQREAKPLFDEAMRNVELMMQQGIIHGDLSAYNILYWEGKITLIDFPQVTQAQTNRNAFKILHRDIQRLCDYFAGYGIRADAQALAEEFWQGYAAPDPDDLAADLSVFEAQRAEQEER